MAGSDIVYLEEIDLLDNSKVVKKVQKKGVADQRPQVGDEVTVHYTGRLLDGTVFDSSVSRNQPFVFTIGQGHVIKGWDVGVLSMEKGEKATLVCQPEFAYGEHGSPPKIPANSVLEFDVELLGFKEKINPESMSADQRVAKAEQLKERGTAAFKEADFEAAVNHYEQVKKLLEGSEDWSDELQKQEEKITISTRLNLAMAYMKLAAWLPAEQEASAVLLIDSLNVKALYRRGVARTNLLDFDGAIIDLKMAAKQEPENPQIPRAIRECEKREQEQKKVEKQVYAKMFNV